MTAPNGKYWKALGKYLQPDVMDTPKLQRPNNARHAINHFAIPVQLLTFSGNTFDGDGRHQRGAPVSVTMHATIQPLSNHSRLRESFPEGESEESAVVVHMDSLYEPNVQASLSEPATFENGLFLQGVGESHFYDRRSFSQIIVWRKTKWKVQSVIPLFYAGDEEENQAGGVYRAICTMWRDVAHEVDAKSDYRELAP
jgi:hypothetical protein